MSKSGPIVIIEDDKDDRGILTEVLHEIGVSNKLIFFDKCQEAFDYLKTTTESIFIILSDINLPGMNGLDLKRKIDNDPELRQKSIPFVFLSTAASQETVTEAYTQMTVQGFFKKHASFEEIKYAVSLIIEYWKLCKHPNSQ